MQVFVTGSSGFLGRHLCAHLEAGGNSVVKANSKNCELTQDHSLEKFNDRKYDLIFHLAAWTRAGEFSATHGGEQWIVNQQININVLAWWQRNQPQAKLVALGTSVCYAKGSELVEEKYLDGLPIDRFYSYAMTKRMLLVGLQTLHQQFDLNYLYAIPSTLYGPGYHTDGRPMHFIFDLIRKMIRGKEFGEDVVLWGDGYQKREVVFLPDFVKLLHQLAESHDNDLVNIGAGEEFTIRHFAQLICEIVGYPVSKVEYDASRYVGARSKCLSIKKIQSILPPFELTPLRQGLEQTVKWFYEANAYL